MAELAARRPGRRKSSRAAKLNRKAHIADMTRLKDQALRLRLVDQQQVTVIHDAVLKILSEIGVVLEHEATRAMLIADHGCRLGDDGYLRMPPDLVERALGTVPRAIRLYDLNGNLKVDTSSRVTAYCPGHNCVRVLDWRTGTLRPCTLQDIRETAKLCEALPNLSMSCSLGYPGDIPAEDEAVETVRTLFAHCTKPAAILAHDEQIQARILSHLSELVGGYGNLADKPVALELMGPISPLRLPGEFCERVINAARHHLPIVCYPADLPGDVEPDQRRRCHRAILGGGDSGDRHSSAHRTGRADHERLGGLAHGHAAGRSGLWVARIHAERARGGGLLFVHRRAVLGRGRFARIPMRSTAQAAAEAGANMAIAALAGTPFVHNLGFLSGGRTGSLEMLGAL